MGRYSDPYPTAHPNKPELEVDGEASIAYARLRKGEKAEDIAESMGLSRATFYRRVERFAAMHDTRTTTYRRMAAEIELDRLTDKAAEALDGDVSVDTLVKVLAELRALNQSRRKLYAVDEVAAVGPTPGPDPDPEVESWVAAAANESEAELRKVRRGDVA